MSYKMILIPEGSTLPEDLQHLYSTGEDIIQKISACKDEQKIISINTRELQLLVEYRDLFDAAPIAIIGMQGAMYNTVWNTYAATMDRKTLDTVRIMLREGNNDKSKAGQDAITRPDRSSRLARLNSAPAVAAVATDLEGRAASADTPEEGEFS